MATQAEIEAAKERWKEQRYQSALVGVVESRDRIEDATLLANVFVSQHEPPVNSKMLCFECCGLDRWRAAECGTLEAQSCQQCGNKSYLREVNVATQQPTIDETTAMPAFVGSDEIEIAGVVYMKKGSQQPVNERLLNAAKAMSCAAERLRHWHDRGPNNEGMVVSADSVRGIWGCEKELGQAISAAEAEIEERRKPVTEDWLKDLPGWELKLPSLVPTYLHKELYAQVNFWPKSGPILLFGATQVNDPQRWHVLDLMRVIGGAT